MKAKDISDRLIPSLEAILESSGYRKYKQRKYLKVVNNILMYIEIVCSRKDLHVWHALYPLFENDIDFGSGAIAGRFPLEERQLKVESEDQFVTIASSLSVELQNAINFQSHRDTVEALEGSIQSSDKALPRFIKGFCLAEQGNFEEAKHNLMPLLDLGLNFGESRKGGLELMESFDSGNTKDLLNTNKNNNIKRLGLSKFI